MPGVRFSDQLAFLNAFTQWERELSRGQRAEFDFCDGLGLSVPTLRNTWEAKVRCDDVKPQLN
jgi:hypothetical protein